MRFQALRNFTDRKLGDRKGSYAFGESYDGEPKIVKGYVDNGWAVVIPENGKTTSKSGQKSKRPESK